MIGFIIIITILSLSIFSLYIGNKIKNIILDKFPNEYMLLSNIEGDDKTISPKEALLIKILWKRKYISLNNKEVTFLCNILLTAIISQLFIAISFILYMTLGIFINAT